MNSLFEDKETFVGRLEAEPSCFKCKLYANVKSPKMNWTGEGKRKALIIAEAPGAEEDEENYQFVGGSGQLLYNELKDLGLELDVDFWKINAVNCRPTKSTGANRTPTVKEIQYCRPMMFNAIKELKPEFIWIMGGVALSSLYMDHFSKNELQIGRWRGLCIPDRLLNAYILPLFHPSAILRNNNENMWSLYRRDLKNAVSCLDKKPFNHQTEKVVCLYEHKEIIDFLLGIKEGETIYIDFETTGLKPYRRGHKIVSVSICTENETCVSFPLGYRDRWVVKELEGIKNSLKKILENPRIKKQAQNLKFEDNWARVVLKSRVFSWDWDTMIASHILDSRKKFTGLKFQTYVNFGKLPYDKGIRKYLDAKGKEFNKVDDAPLSDLLFYGGLDSLFGSRLAKKQKQIFSREENSDLKRAYDFFHRGILEFSQIQHVGIPIDEKYYKKTDESLEKDINKILERITNSKEAAQSEKELRKKFSVSSQEHLSHIIYNILGQDKLYTEKGSLSLDKDALSRTKNPFTDNFLRLRKLEKIKGTYLAQFMREVYKGRMHPFSDLHIPRSYRSSMSNPNFQNIPIRDEEAKIICRKGIIPTKGNKLLEVDYSGIEVSIGACYHKDPNMIVYISDPSTDMHRDTACDIWILPVSEIAKEIRFYAKNKWVFAEFYGSYYGNCAPDLWELCLDLKTTSGIKLRDHLKKKGIKTLNDFVEHCKEVERIFWEVRFPVYAQWKEEINRYYRKHGYIPTCFGFRCSGDLSYNDAANHQIQGTAFHCLLWSLIEIQKVSRKERWRSKIISQIHDSILFDLHPSEEEHVIEVVNEIATKKIREEFDWIIVPLKLEFEATPINGSWDEKKEITI